MTLNDGFERIVSDWLDEQAGRGASGYLDEILTRTTQIRQRPAWSRLERLSMMETTFRSRTAPIAGLAWAVALVAILVLAAALLLFAGAGQRRLPHFGAEANGEIIYADGGNLKVAGPDGTKIRSLMALPGTIESLTFSPDGTRLAYRTTHSVPSIVVADADGAHPVVVAIGPQVATGGPIAIAWSPDGRRIAFTEVVGQNRTIAVVGADGSHLTNILDNSAAGSVDRFDPAWSPDGQWISFFSSEPKGYVGLNVVHPDGTGATLLHTSPMNPDLLLASWSPDPSASRLTYVAGGYVKVWDLARSVETTVGVGFWPTWSPDGQRISWWNDGTQVVDFGDLLGGKGRALALASSFHGNCQDNSALAGKAICGPARWSPDGLWVYGPDVTGTSIVIVPSDGSDLARTIRLDHPIDLSEPLSALAWQPIAP